MPIRDRQRRLEAQRQWREEQSDAYHKWLYDRRKLRFGNAERFRKAIEDSLSVDDDVVEIRIILEDALLAADKAERRLGNRFDHARDEPYYDADAADVDRARNG